MKNLLKSFFLWKAGFFCKLGFLSCIHCWLWVIVYPTIYLHWQYERKNVYCLYVTPLIFGLHQSNTSMQTSFVGNRLLCWMSSPLSVMCCLLTVLSIGESSQEAVHTPWQSTDSLNALHGCSRGFRMVARTLLLAVTSHSDHIRFLLTKEHPAVHMLLLLILSLNLMPWCISWMRSSWRL